MGFQSEMAAPIAFDNSRPRFPLMQKRLIFDKELLCRSQIGVPWLLAELDMPMACREKYSRMERRSRRGRVDLRSPLPG